MKVDRVVVDTNVLIGAVLLPASLPRRVVDAVGYGGGLLVFSQQTFDELSTRLRRPKFDAYVTADDRAVFLQQVESVSLWVPISGETMGCRDPDDDAILETALVASADAIVTGDRDLLAMSPFRAIPILEPRAFLATLT